MIIIPYKRVYYFVRPKNEIVSFEERNFLLLLTIRPSKVPLFLGILKLKKLNLLDQDCVLTQTAASGIAERKGEIEEENPLLDLVDRTRKCNFTY